MKHLDREHAPLEQVANKRRSGSSILKSVFVLLAVMLGMGYGMTALHDPGGEDRVSLAARQQLLKDYNNLDPIKLKPVLDQDTDQALDLMRLQPSQRKLLKQKLSSQSAQYFSKSFQMRPRSSSNETALNWITLWDFASQDGDVVTVSSAGYTVDVPLLKSPTRIAIPINSSRTIELTGNTDGGGGITLALMSGSFQTSLPVLRVGETINLSISP